MLPIHDNDFGTIEYDAGAALIRSHWKSASVDMTEAEFKAELKTLLDFVIRLKPKGILVNTVDFRLEVTATEQNWLVTFFMEEVMRHGVKRYAIVVTPGHYRLLEAETLNDEVEESFALQYFTHEPRANAWLLEAS